jgi:predicted DNA-binding transcriptional regulator AlpA
MRKIQMPNQTTNTESGREFYPARRVWERYDISDMTLYRWINSERMKFPKPVYLGRLRYWNISDSKEWELQRITNSQERQETSGEAA